MILRISLLALGVAALAACGGGGGGGGVDTPSSTSLTINGTVATGLAISGATVTGKCKVGGSFTTTSDTGTYTLVVPNGQLPCVLQVTNPVDEVKLHTLAFDIGSRPVIANITLPGKGCAA